MPKSHIIEHKPGLGFMFRFLSILGEIWWFLYHWRFTFCFAAGIASVIGILDAMPDGKLRAIAIGAALAVFILVGWIWDGSVPRR